MKISRYTATGNSFLVCDTVGNALADDSKSAFVLANSEGRDGVIFVEKRERFFMDYFNRDGQRASFCGNGARSFVRYLFDSGYAKGGKVIFDSFSGAIEGWAADGGFTVKMPPVTVERKTGSTDGISVFAGVPHHVVFVEDVESVDVAVLGAALRKEFGANVDFVQILERGKIKMRTYERGVEAETMACGTGAAASACVSGMVNGWQTGKIEVLVPGGLLKISAEKGSVFLHGAVDAV